MTSSKPSGHYSSEIDLTNPSVARVYDYYLGGTTNWSIDREFAERVIKKFPLVKSMAIANRLFLQRAVRYLTRQGIRQFIDIGSGIPTKYNTHSVADEISDGSQVVYVDNEPVAVTHSNIILRENGDPSRHAAIEADLREPDALLDKVQRTGLIDFDAPVALLFVAVLHVRQTDDSGNEIGEQVMSRYRARICPGSFLAVSHVTNDGVPSRIAPSLREMETMYERAGSPITFRNQAEIASLIGPFSPVPSQFTWTTQWGKEFARDSEPNVMLDAPNESLAWAGIGRKDS